MHQSIPTAKAKFRLLQTINQHMFGMIYHRRSSFHCWP